MWNLRWQVQGYVGVRANATEEELMSRFIAGSNIKGANLRRSCIETSWEQQTERFAQFLLVELCAIYEGWLSEVLVALGKHTKNNLKGLQFPGEYEESIRRITSPKSTLIEECIYPGLLKNKKCCSGNVKELLHCYRFFKECRNAIAHNGGVASDKVVGTYANFSSLRPQDLCAREIPEHHPIAKGAPVRLSLRGIAGLSDIILKLVCTMDAELARAETAEKIFVQRWLTMHDRKVDLKKQGTGQREQQIKRLVKKLELPVPLEPLRIAEFLKKESVVN